LVSDIHDIYRDIAVDAGRLLDLSDDHHDVPSWVWGDIDLLKQMCVNLLVNAMRHTPQGARIVIGVAADADALILIVSDNGPGIPEEERDKVFKRFYRLEKSRTTERTGLGLSLVKAISDMHGAVITLTDNRPGLVVSIAFSKAS
ncbi:ATP-binding protein, partial [Pseudomonas syringae]|nr:ATP-binding protein [Pseudomonas syringae]